ncbi:hypothetical protein JB92DRAFT_2824425 [Gautieria morchelliformis]|nr:hypothetical protein JB92DRAFT_2824425 [Gautieria morchelliformis]
MDVSKVTRSRLQGRVPVLYVLPAGTRAATLAAAQDFAVTSKAQKPADFVTKQNEPGDVGINGVISATPNAPIPLNTFRSKVLRVVVKIDNNPKAKGKATFQTIANGKISKTANKADQSAFNAVC